MKHPATPSNESERLEELHKLGILDTQSEERFDRFTRLARRLFDVPIVLVSLVDANRQWFKSRQGLNAVETPRDISFCGHAILNDETLVVEDTTADNRFNDNPLVTSDPNIRFYAGCPVQSPSGHPLGTVCLIDDKPRVMTDEDLETLRDISAMVSAEIASLQMAMTDDLTEISNRRGFDMLASQALAMCRRNGQTATLVMIDMDGFKQINDRFGHHEGDRALRSFASLLLQTFRDSDVIARFGGDEFCALLTGTNASDAQISIKRLEAAVGDFNRQSELPFSLHFSTGTVSCAVETDLAELLRKADRQMYAAKSVNKRSRA